MSPGQFHHPRFIGERGGRQQQCLVGENSVRSTGWSTGSLGEDLVGRIAKPNFAGACEMRSTRTTTRRNRPSGPRERAGDERVSRGRRASSPGVEKKSRFALFLSPKSSERLVRHARARIPNDVRVREGDYFVGSRAPQTQGRKEERKRARKSEISISMDLFRWSHQKLTLRFALDCDPRWQHPWLEEASSGACLCA